MTIPDAGGQPTPTVESTPMVATESETAPETVLSTAVSEDTPSDGVAKRASAQARARVQQFLQGHPRMGAVWVATVGDRPRDVWSSAPASPAEVLRYAAAGEWCSAESQVLRKAGVAYGYAAAWLTAVVGLLTWALQRPGRAAAAALLLTVLWFVL